MEKLVIIPTYNEKENISKMLSALMGEFVKIKKNLKLEMSVLVVDDNSPDGTGKLVSDFSKKNKRLKNMAIPEQILIRSRFM